MDSLRQNGYTNGTTAIIDIRPTDGNADSGGKLPKQLIAQHPDVTYALPGALARYVLKALSHSAQDIPVVVFALDPRGLLRP